MLASLLRWSAVGLTSPPLLSTSAVLSLVDRERSVEVLRAWGRLQARVLGMRVHVEDRSGGLGAGPYLFVQLNQESLLDVVAWAYAMHAFVRPVINIEFALLPWVGWSLALSGRLVVVRQWRTQALRVMKRAEDALRRGESVGLSIEGRRSPDGTLMPYKKGPVVMAINTRTPIVPVVFSGTREVLPHGGLRIQPGEVTVTVLPPMSTENLSLEDRDVLLEELRRIAEGTRARA